MIDTPNPIKISIEHQQSVQHGHKQCCDVSVPLPQSMVFSLEQLSVTKAIDSNDDDNDDNGARRMARKKPTKMSHPELIGSKKDELGSIA